MKMSHQGIDGLLTWRTMLDTGNQLDIYQTTLAKDRVVAHTESDNSLCARVTELRYKTYSLL